jgi:hypothetical protein
MVDSDSHLVPKLACRRRSLDEAPGDSMLEAGKSGQVRMLVDHGGKEDATIGIRWRNEVLVAALLYKMA